jgi:hypothetical protein
VAQQQQYSVHMPAGPPSQPPSRVASLTIPSAELRAFKPNRGLAIGIGVGVATALFAVIVMVAVAATSSEPGEVTAVEPQALPTRPDPEPTEVPAQKPERIEVRIRATPTDAKLLLDGRSLDANPFLGNFSKDGRITSFASRPTAANGNTAATFDRDVIIELGLRKTSSGRVTARPGAARQKVERRRFPDLPGPRRRPPSAPSIPTTHGSEFALLRRLAVLVALFSLLLAPSVAFAQAPSKEQIAEARAHYQKGLDLYEEGDYDAALVELQRAYDTAPAYKILYNIGLVQRQLKDYAGAVRSFRKFLEDGGKKIDAKRKSEIEKEVDKLQGRVADQLKSNVRAPWFRSTTRRWARLRSTLPEPLVVNQGRRKITLTQSGISAPRASSSSRAATPPISKPARARRARSDLPPGRTRQAQPCQAGTPLPPSEPKPPVAAASVAALGDHRRARRGHRGGRRAHALGPERSESERDSVTIAKSSTTPSKTHARARHRRAAGGHRDQRRHLALHHARLGQLGARCHECPRHLRSSWAWVGLVSVARLVLSRRRLFSSVSHEVRDPSTVFCVAL